MNRLIAALCALLLASCASQTPKPITPKQAAQVNVQISQPEPFLARWGDTNLHLANDLIIGLKYLIHDGGIVRFKLSVPPEIDIGYYENNSIGTAIPTAAATK